MRFFFKNLQDFSKSSCYTMTHPWIFHKHVQPCPTQVISAYLMFFGRIFGLPLITSLERRTWNLITKYYPARHPKPRVDLWGNTGGNIRLLIAVARRVFTASSNTRLCGSVCHFMELFLSYKQVVLSAYCTLTQYYWHNKRKSKTEIGPLSWDQRNAI